MMSNTHLQGCWEEQTAWNNDVAWLKVEIETKKLLQVDGK